MISKKSCSDVAISRRTSELQECFQDCKDDYVQSIVEMCKPNIENKKPVDCQQTSNEVLDQLVKLPLPDTYFDNMQRMDSTHNCTSNLETMFSPALEHVEVDNVADIDAKIAGRNIGLTVEKGGDDFITDARSSSDYQTCTVSDFFISDMIFAGLPFDEDLVNDDINRINSYTDSGFRCVKTNILLDVDDECMMLPILEDTAKLSYSSEMRSCEEPKIDFGNDSSYLAVTQMRSYNLDYDVKSSSDQAEEFDFQFFVKRVPELSDMVPNSRPSAPKESRTKSITLVLDLDETLIHSRLEHCDDADFTFNMFFGMKDHVVYVKQRPHLHTFLKRVAELFEVVIFTASESIYAGQLLDRLDPEGKLISWRIYRESCIFSDGSYTKDLTILGVDLAKVVIIDNTPQVFRLQVNNGIPIKSWFGDPSDCALISLLPFLETLVDVDDVRPIIAKRFGNKE